MLMTSERRPAIRTLRGWAIHVLQEAGAIRECEEHGWMQDRADPHARERAFDIARRNPPAGVSTDEAAAEVRVVLDSIGDTCPECPLSKYPPAEPGALGLGPLEAARIAPKFASYSEGFECLLIQLFWPHLTTAPLFGDRLPLTS